MSMNFVIFGSNEDFYLAAYNDILDLKNVRYIGGALDTESKLFNTLYRFHTTPKINKYINIPFKRIYNSLYFLNDFGNDLPLCFIFFGYSRGKILDWGYYDYIKRKFPSAKLVCYFQDLISTNKNLEFEKFRKYFDLILTFDKGDSEKYNLIYYSLVYSSKCPFVLTDNFSDSDVFFAGKAKDRLLEIIKAYEVLRNAGLRCDFHISGADVQNRPYQGAINYCDNMPYKEYLERVKATNCILEIMQHGGRGYTLRVDEAIAYNKKLLSNNSELYNAEFYNEHFISVFENPENIDIKFVKEHKTKINHDLIEQISPISLLQFIENELSKTKWEEPFNERLFYSN